MHDIATLSIKALKERYPSENRSHQTILRGARSGERSLDQQLRRFPDFLRELGPRPSDKHSVDRIDGKRGYEPGNLRWATSRGQAANRANAAVAICPCTGNRYSFAELAKRHGISRRTVSARRKEGWPDAELIAGHQSPALRNQVPPRPSPVLPAVSQPAPPLGAEWSTDPAVEATSAAVFARMQLNELHRWRPWGNSTREEELYDQYRLRGESRIEFLVRQIRGQLDKLHDEGVELTLLLDKRVSRVSEDAYRVGEARLREIGTAVDRSSYRLKVRRLELERWLAAVSRRRVLQD